MNKRLVINMPWHFRLLMAALVLTLSGYLSSPALAQANKVTFPPLDKMIQYTQVERGNVFEQMLANPETLDLIMAGRPLPVGTQIVLVDHRDGKLFRYLVSQRMGLGKDDWQYQSFLPNRSIQTDENPARCFSCHQSRQDRQYMFTYTDAMRFKR